MTSFSYYDLSYIGLVDEIPESGINGQVCICKKDTYLYTTDTGWIKVIFKEDFKNELIKKSL